MTEAIQKGFPPAIAFPEELVKLCDWNKENGYPISGGFELRADDGEAIYWWFRSHAADDRLAQFGAGPDGSLYCIWKQEDGRQPVVHMGSEGDELKILAGSMKEFITLLAVGYEELGFDDLENEPDEEDKINLDFQKWVTNTFGVSIPKTGIEIQGPASKSHYNFEAWVAAVPTSENQDNKA